MWHRHPDHGVRLHGSIHLHTHPLAIWRKSRENLAASMESGAIAVRIRAETGVWHGEREQVCLGRIHAHSHKLDRGLGAWLRLTLTTIKARA